MSGFPTFAARPLDPADLAEARALVAAAGVHGVYVQNALGEHGTLCDANVVGLHGHDALLGLCYFGPRGNLIVIERRPLHSGALARAILGSGAPWRIVLAAEPVVRCLAGHETTAPLVERNQVYYGVRRGGVTAGLRPAAVRRAVRKDVKALTAAALDLNRSDLNVDAWRVNRSWLRDSIRERIRQGRTLVIGVPGAPQCKVDVGSRGEAGTMLEGVYTVPSMRGQGLATVLVATVAEEFLAETPLVCLHVAERNQPARCCYERAGMVEMGACRLLLRG